MKPLARLSIRLLLLSSLLAAHVSRAGEDLITSAKDRAGNVIPYILNWLSPSPKYVFILFPGGVGNVNPRIENGVLVYGYQSNFLLRARVHIVDEEFSTVTASASQSPEYVQALLDDLAGRFPGAEIYLVGTSMGTFDTMELAGYLADKIAGEIHTASLRRIALFDASKYANRHLVVHHRQDACRNTPFASAEGSHERYGNELISMEGGSASGDPCEPLSHHGFFGIERETVDAIKSWVKRGRPAR